MSSKTSGKQIQLEGMSIQCETCSKPIGKKEAIFRCVCCATIMHMSPSCTKLSIEIINALQQVNQNVLLLCNASVQQNKRDVILDIIKSPPQKQNNLVIKDDIQTTIKETISSKINEIENKLPTANNNIEKNHTVKARTTNDLAIRIRAIDESKKETARERAEEDIQEIQSILKFLKLDCQIPDCRRMGAFKDGRHRTILATIPCMYDKRILLLSLSRLKRYSKTVYISKDYSLQEEEQLNNCLKKRKDLIDAGFPRKNLKVMNLTLYEKQDENWVEYLDNARYTTWLAKNTDKKQEVSILPFNLHSFIDLPRRFAFANAIVPYNPDILCLTETWLTEEVPNEELFLKNYVIHRNDRTSKCGVSKHGGVLVAVKDNIQSKELFVKNTWEGCLIVKINTKTDSILIVCIYNPPKGSPYRWCKQKFEDLTQTLKFLEKKTKPKSVIITGDLNFSTTDWKQISSPDELDNTGLNYFVDENFEQMLNFTDLLGYKKQLDVFLTNEPQFWIN